LCPVVCSAINLRFSCHVKGLAVVTVAVANVVAIVLLLRTLTGVLRFKVWKGPGWTGRQTDRAEHQK
jgi:hypothetical protein